MDEPKSDLYKQSSGDTSRQAPPPILTPPVEGYKNPIEPYNAKDRKGKSYYTEKPRHWIEFVEAFCGIALVAITAVYTLYAARQSVELIRSNEISAKALRATLSNFQQDQRPWVGLQDVTCEQCTISSGVVFRAPWLKAKLINSGRSPAQNATIEIESLEQVEPLGRIPEIGDARNTVKIHTFRSGYGPPEKIGAIAPSASRVVILGGDLRLSSTHAATYVYGIVRYFDLTGAPHGTRFCLQHYWAMESPEFEFCQGGNEMN